jgi:hypothetical protein
MFLSQNNPYLSSKPLQMPLKAFDFPHFLFTLCGKLDNTSTPVTTN